jgi:hypothetical protein
MSETPSTPESPFSKEDLKKAYQAFKKRMKLTKLDDESKVGHGPMSGGGRSGVVAILPPNQFPKEIWQELVKQGRLKNAGHGMYEMAGP